jgi:hypothetical protein
MIQMSRRNKLPSHSFLSPLIFGDGLCGLLHQRAYAQTIW